ncbi:MAG: hypothetical protein ABSF34_13670 [Verrucomicrobiota bacterium]|jgi:hypothetical protein
MKNDLTTTFLNFVLAMLVFLTVGFGLLTIWREPKLPIYTAAAMQDNNNLVKIQSLLNEAAAYNVTARSSELAGILQTVEQKPASR